MKEPLTDVILTVGGRREKLTVDPVFEAFFATVSASLEPRGRGSRFPILMNKLYNGVLSPADAPAVIAELAAIDQELSKVPASAVLWPHNSRHSINVADQPVEHFASNVRSYFVTPTGEYLVTCLKNAAQDCQEQKKTLRIATASLRTFRLMGNAVLVIGFLTAVIGYLYYRDWFLVSSATIPDHDDSPMPIWRGGVFFFFVGAAMFASSYVPRLYLWTMKHPRLSKIALAALALVMDHSIFGRY